MAGFMSGISMTSLHDIKTLNIDAIFHTKQKYLMNIFGKQKILLYILYYNHIIIYYIVAIYVYIFFLRNV